MFSDLLGVRKDDKEFIIEYYLPALEEKISHINLDALERAELSENTLGSVIKLFYAFFWQEGIDLGGKKMMFNDK